MCRSRALRSRTRSICWCEFLFLNGTTGCASTERGGYKLSLSRLDVHEHIGDSRVGSPNRVLDLMGDVMPVAHRNISIHFHVKIDIKIEAHFSNETFVD